MAIDIVAQWDSRQLSTLLSALEPRQWEFATALALTRTAQAVKADERTTMARVFDRPTPFTLNSLRIDRATRQRPQARVWFRDPPRLTESTHYLMPQVYGGERIQKRFEATLQRAGLLTKGMALVPTAAAAVDAFGNVRRGIYARILADLKASPVGANRRNRGGRSGRVAFFYGRPGNSRLARGIWRRTANGGVEPWFLETRMPRYRVRFPFFEVAQRTADARVGPEFDAAAAQVLRTARP